MPSTRLRSIVAVLVLALCACSSPSEGDTTASGGGSTPTTGDTAPTTTTEPAPTTTSTTLPAGTEELPEEIREDLAELIDVTEEVRQLDFLEQPSIAVVSDEELAQRVREQLEEDLEDLPADEALYVLLGLIDEDLELQQLYSDLYSEQVAGYYDGETDELVVPAADEGFTSVQRATLVHELTHALTDQHHEFHERYVEMLDEDRYDEASAYQALIEGDATLSELLYLQRLSPEEQGQFFEEAFQADTQALDDAPQFLRDALVFPYEAGFTFVDRVYGSGGFVAVGDAYADPPSSTEQVIDPADYPADAPISVNDPGVTLDGYELAYASTWGELGFRLMFEQVLGDEAAETAAHGWGGDAYQLHFDGTEVVLALHYVGDSAGDAEEMGAALGDYVLAAMDVDPESETETAGGSALTGEDHAWIRVDGSDVYFVASSAAEPFEAAVEPFAATHTDTDTDG